MSESPSRGRTAYILSLCQSQRCLMTGTSGNPIDRCICACLWQLSGCLLIGTNNEKAALAQPWTEKHAGERVSVPTQWIYAERVANWFLSNKNKPYIRTLANWIDRCHGKFQTQRDATELRTGKATRGPMTPASSSPSTQAFVHSIAKTSVSCGMVG